MKNDDERRTVHSISAKNWIWKMMKARGDARGMNLSQITAQAMWFFVMHDEPTLPKELPENDPDNAPPPTIKEPLPIEKILLEKNIPIEKLTSTAMRGLVYLNYQGSDVGYYDQCDPSIFRIFV